MNNDMNLDLYRIHGQIHGCAIGHGVVKDMLLQKPGCGSPEEQSLRQERDMDCGL